MSETEVKRRGNINLYKPNKGGTGAAAQFSLKDSNDCMFLEAAPQFAPIDSPAPYDWSKKIIVKLGNADITKMLAYFNAGPTDQPLKLFHQSPAGGSKTIELKYQEYKGAPSYFLSISAKGADASSQATRVSLPVGMDEVELLRIGFRMGLEIMLGWR